MEASATRIGPSEARSGGGDRCICGRNPQTTQSRLTSLAPDKEEVPGSSPGSPINNGPQTGVVLYPSATLFRSGAFDKSGAGAPRLPRRAPPRTAKLGGALISAQPHPLQQAREGRALRGVGTAANLRRRDARRLQLSALAWRSDGAHRWRRRSGCANSYSDW